MNASSCLLRSISLLLLAGSVATGAEEPKKKDAPPPPSPVPTSFMPVVPKEDFKSTMERMKAGKAAIEKSHHDLLSMRYDLRDDPRSRCDDGAAEAGAGGRARAPAQRHDVGSARGADARTDPRKGSVARGLFPLPHPNHPEEA